MLAVKITLAIALILSIVVPFGAYAIGEKSRGHYKKSLAINIISFFGILIISQIVMFTGNVSAAEAATTATSSGLATGLGYIGAALAVNARRTSPSVIMPLSCWFSITNATPMRPSFIMLKQSVKLVSGVVIGRRVCI